MFKNEERGKSVSKGRFANKIGMNRFSKTFDSSPKFDD
jgi:hypothetical protein